MIPLSSADSLTERVLLSGWFGYLCMLEASVALTGKTDTYAMTLVSAGLEYNLERRAAFFYVALTVFFDQLFLC